MKRPKTLWPILGAALFAGALLGLFFLLFEHVEEDVDTGFRGEARWNPLLAAERFLTGWGYEADTVLGKLDPPASDDHAVILVSPRLAPPTGLEDELLAWVAGGGHLVVTPVESIELSDPEEDNAEHDVVIRRDPFLEALGVAVLPHERPPAAEKPEAEESSGETEAEASSAPQTVVTVKVAEDYWPVEVALPRPPRLRATSAPEWASPTAQAAFLLRYVYGKGRITVLSDADFFDNQHIGEHDHARLLLQILEVGSDANSVSLVYRDLPPSLWGLLAEHAWEALGSALVLVVAWILFAGRRFGPLVAEPVAQRRSLVEHVEATGEFFWHHGQGPALVEAVRQRLQARVAVAQPAWSKLPERELVERLAEASGQLPVPVDRALHGDVGLDPSEFVRTVRTLEDIRRSL